MIYATENGASLAQIESNQFYHVLGSNHYKLNSNSLQLANRNAYNTLSSRIKSLPGEFHNASKDFFGSN